MTSYSGEDYVSASLVSESYSQRLVVTFVFFHSSNMLGVLEFGEHAVGQ